MPKPRRTAETGDAHEAFADRDRAVTVAAAGAQAQDYPTRPIMLIIPTAVGAGNDARPHHG